MDGRMSNKDHKSLPSKENGVGLPIVILVKSEWSGFSRKLSSSGTITLGTRIMGFLPAFNHASPDSWQACGAGSSLQLEGMEFRAIAVTKLAGKLIGKITYSMGTDGLMWTSVSSMASDWLELQ